MGVTYGYTTLFDLLGGFWVWACLAGIVIGIAMFLDWREKRR